MGNSLVGVPSDPITLGQNSPSNWQRQLPGDMRFLEQQRQLKPLYDDASLGQYRRMSATDPMKLYQYQTMLAQAGYMSMSKASPVYSADFQKAMAKAMTDANFNGMDVGNLLKVRAMEALSGKGAGGSGSGSGSRTSTQTSINRSYNITSRPTAQSLLQQTLARELGREPSAQEVTRFVKALNKEERANPSISKSTSTTTSSGGHTSTSGSSTSTPSSVDPQAEADQYGKKVSPDERHMYQQSNYYDVIAQMVGGV